MSGVSDRGRTSRYARYAGGPDPLAPPVDLREALDAIGEEVMAGVSPERAMRELLRQGTQSRIGLDNRDLKSFIGGQERGGIAARTAAENDDW